MLHAAAEFFAVTIVGLLNASRRENGETHVCIKVFGELLRVKLQSSQVTLKATNSCITQQGVSVGTPRHRLTPAWQLQCNLQQKDPAEQRVLESVSTLA